MMLMIVTIFLFTLGLFPLFKTVNSTSYFLDKFDSSPPFHLNFLDQLHFPTYNSTLSKAIDTVHDAAGNIYILGLIHLINTNTPPFDVTNVSGDDLRSDNDDILLTCVTQNGSIAWSRRTGSPLRDEAGAITMDTLGNIYISAYVLGTIGDNGSGSVVMKFDSTGRRLWVEAYGSRIGRERLHALVVTNDGKQIIAVGEASEDSALLSDVWNGGPGISAFILSIDTRTGSLKAAGHASAISGTSASSASSVTLATLNQNETVIAAGYAIVSETGRTNGALFSFSLPYLKQTGGVFVESSRHESFTAIAASLNGYSAYVTGTTFISEYEEHDVIVARLNTIDLSVGWSVLLGSIRFLSIASIRNGAAEEYGCDISVDMFGNIHVLVESTSRMHAFDTIGSNSDLDDLTNKRPAIVTLAPNGSVVLVTQSQYTRDVFVKSLEVMDEVMMVAGSTFNETTATIFSVFCGMKRNNETTRSHGNEFQPGVDGGEPKENPFAETIRTMSFWFIIVCVIAGISILVVVCIIITTCVIRRFRQNRIGALE